MYRYTLLVYLILFNFIRTNTSLQSDALFVLSAPGHHLTHHVITEEDTSSVTECAQYCLKKIYICKSFNYKSKQNQQSWKNCQLNNATKSVKPQNFLANNGYNYYEPSIKEKQITQTTLPVIHARSCDALYKSGKTTTGVYTIEPDDQGAFQVRCDMTSSPGTGWTTFQRRVDGSVDFYRSWADYKNGFGNLDGEFWLGLDKIQRLSASGQNVLRVDLESFENEKKYANYGTFSVGNEDETYILKIGQYTGDAGDSLNYHYGMKFTTKDDDNDQDSNRNCAQVFKGAWWYKHCHSSNLNGQYLNGSHASYADGVNWALFKGHHYSLKKTEMKVRPTV